MCANITWNWLKKWKKSCAIYRFALAPVEDEFCL